MSGNTVFVLAPFIDILETLGVSLINLSFINVTYFGCCFLVLLSDKLANEVDLVLFSGFNVFSVSVLSEYLGLSNEHDLFNAMTLFHSLSLLEK